MKKLLFTLIIVTAAFSAAKAQYKDNSTELGDKAFENKDYYEAAYYYKKSAEGLSLIKREAIPYHSGTKNVKKGNPKDRAYISYRLAESYRGYENYLEAEGWYYQVLDEGYESGYPLTRYWYGVCLRANQHFDEAIKELKIFQQNYKGEEKYKTMAAKEIKNCLFAQNEYEHPFLLEVKKRKGVWNSDGSDYAITHTNQKTYFTSSRFVKNDKTHLNRVYMAAGDDSPQVIKFKDDDGIKDIEYGTPTFSADGQRMYFTRWYKVGSKITHEIYSSNFAGNEWGKPQKLNTHVNADGYNSIQPYITADGKKLFFTSNKPGGLGGQDIWVSDLDADGTPLNSKNLGDKINTAMDEQAAYYDVATRRLIYSSKGFTGLGGFDFFEANNKNNVWSVPQNMGYPINSAKDDLYYMPDTHDQKKFYISSDRESECCLNLFEVYDKSFIVKGIVTDCDTQTALPGVKISLVDSLSKQTIAHLISAKDGVYQFNIVTHRPYNLVLEKSGYFTKVLPMPESGKVLNDTLYSPDICLQAFKVDKPIIIKNVLYDFDKATLRPESKLVLDKVVTILKDNPKMKIELAAHTDSVGTEAYNKKLSQQRAQACVDYLVQKGISESRVYAKGYGELKPIAPNSLPNGKDNPAGRQMNRRTEFTVLKIE
ncbi:OmpA family protein [Mucilaginibacter segetis]|uniref:OmpA family protein n=1 Tax=Mucilaginibacter segetis TaxID=2793071 RepID=A0A934UN67_9SPHI|nr:OmpA family protein [Mucilaginibacter segetis]MBK0380468.1 OmpA family protein [Mucilaginibacter segetis]